MLKKLLAFAVCVALPCGPLSALDLTSGLEAGSVELQSAGPLAFGPDGILFVADSKAATVHAIATGDTSGNPESVSINVEGINQKIAAALGTKTDSIEINDLAVNPLSGNVYLSVARGRGPDAVAVVLRVDPSGEISEVALKNTKHDSTQLPNAPSEDATDRRNRPLRPMSVTDLAYLDGRLLVAGLSTEEFSSTLRVIPFPFEAETTDAGTGVGIYHGAHGRFETNSPVRTFTTIEIGDEPHLLAAYQCTPLVRIPLSDLVPGEKVSGTTIAELGNRNRPLDMVVYERHGKQYILMANSSRGVMKIQAEGIESASGISEKISGVAGQPYETVDELTGVVQLDRLNDKHALVLTDAGGDMHLRTVALP